MVIKSNTLSKMLLLFIGILLVWNCTDSNNPNAASAFEGIVETDSQGTILEDDPDDWQPRCSAQSNAPLCLKPAYPNPTGAITTLEWTMNDTFMVEFSVSNMPDSTIVFLLKDTLKPGNYQLLWDAGGLPDGIYRISINAMNNGVTHTETYGDVRIQTN